MPCLAGFTFYRYSSFGFSFLAGSTYISSSFGERKAISVVNASRGGPVGPPRRLDVTTPMLTGNRCASKSSSGLWHRDSIWALLDPHVKNPCGTFWWLRTTELTSNPITIMPPHIVARTIGRIEYPTAEPLKREGSSSSPSVSKPIVWTTNRLWDTSQWSMIMAIISVIEYVRGRESI